MTKRYSLESKQAFEEVQRKQTPARHLLSHCDAVVREIQNIMGRLSHTALGRSYLLQEG